MLNSYSSFSSPLLYIFILYVPFSKNFILELSIPVICNPSIIVSTVFSVKAPFVGNVPNIFTFDIDVSLLLIISEVTVAVLLSTPNANFASWFPSLFIVSIPYSLILFVVITPA